MNKPRSKRTICFYARSGQNELYARIGRKLEGLGFKTVYIVQNSPEEKLVRSFHPEGSIYNLTSYIEENWDNAGLLNSLPLDGIEAKYDIPSLWGLLYSDRFLVKYPHDEAVKFIKLHVAFIEEIVFKENIGVLVNEVVALFSAYVMYYAARLYGFQYLSLIVPRNFALEKFHFSQEWHGGIEELDKYYHGDDLTVAELRAAQSFIDQLVRTGVKPEYAKISKPRLSLTHVKEIGRYLLSFSKSVSRQNYELFYERARLYLYSLKNLINYHRQKQFYNEPDYDRPYYFLPLHFQPEATTLVYAPNYEKQSLALDLVAKKIPGDTLLYVKEHHFHVGHREMEFYRNLKRYPNVRLISPWVDSHRLIRNSRGVIVITSTVGWEAMMYGKPVFLLGRVFYESFKYIHRIDNIDDLTATLKAAALQEVPKEEYNRELVKYVAAYLKSLKPGNYYLSDPSVLDPENIDRLTEALAREINTLDSMHIDGSKESLEQVYELKSDSKADQNNQFSNPNWASRRRDSVPRGYQRSLIEEINKGDNLLTLAILQARTSSTRLPGKVLKPILGQPMLARQLERNLRSKNIDKLVVATSDRPDDQPIADLCKEIGVECFRGSLNDVLDRYYQAALKNKADHIVRLTGDCPLADPVVIDRVIEFYHSGGYDYVSNIFKPTFPHGLDVEVFRFEALKAAWQEATLPAQREHVAPFIWRQPDRFKLANFKQSEDLSHYRWTVDEPEDFELITAIYEGLYPTNPEFDMEAIVKFLSDNPELQEINRGFHRNPGLLESLKADGTVVAK